MRITDNLLRNNMVNGIQQSLADYEKKQWQVSSGKRIRTLSDDPTGSAKVLNLRSSLRDMDQFDKNITSVKSSLDNSENLIMSAKNIISSLKADALRAVNDATANADVKKQIAAEVTSLRSQLLGIANTQLDGVYVFAGQKVKTKPFDDDGTYRGDTNAINKQVGPGGIMITANVNGDEAFNDEVNIFQIAQDLADGLNTDDADKISQQLDKLDTASNQLLTVVGSIGARTNQADNAATMLIQSQDLVTNMLSDTEDVDTVKAVTDLKTAENVYQSSLYASSIMMQTSLLNFLK